MFLNENLIETTCKMSLFKKLCLKMTKPNGSFSYNLCHKISLLFLGLLKIIKTLLQIHQFSKVTFDILSSKKRR